jgi:hypothetical protein
MVAQHMSALKQANAVRLPRALLRREIRSGRRAVEEVILDTPEEALTATFGELLVWQHGWGHTRARRFLARLQKDAVFVSELRVLRDLTRRERSMIVARLAEESGVSARSAA